MQDDLSDPIQAVPSLASGAEAVPSAEAREASRAAPNWFEQDDLLRTMWREGISPQVISEKLGRSVAAIMTRAVRLGLPRRAAPGRKVGYRRPEGAPPPVRRTSTRRPSFIPETGEEASPRTQPAMRVCLMCLNKFESEGRHNRICPLCKGSAEYTKASSLPDTSGGEGL